MTSDTHKKWMGRREVAQKLSHTVSHTAGRRSCEQVVAQLFSCLPFSSHPLYYGESNREENVSGVRERERQAGRATGAAAMQSAASHLTAGTAATTAAAGERIGWQRVRTISNSFAQHAGRVCLLPADPAAVDAAACPALPSSPLRLSCTISCCLSPDQSTSSSSPISLSFLVHSLIPPPNHCQAKALERKSIPLPGD